MNLSLNEFKKLFADAIEDESVLQIEANSSFKNLESWDSFSGMSIISMIDEEFGITIKAEEMAKINTLEEMYALIESRT